MSLNAFTWASGLPLDVCNFRAYRVLLVLADHAHKNGKNAFRSKKSMAEELGCSERTIQRAYADLRDLGLIVEGDQQLVAHMPADRRPTVYDLNFSYGLYEPVTVPLDGETELSRGDTNDSDGETAGVALRTKNRTLIETSQGNQTGPVSPTRCSAYFGGHRFASSGYCACGTRDDS